MRSLTKILLSIFLLINLSQAGELKIMTEIFSPYQFKDKDGKLTGISIDIVNAIKQKIGDDSKIKIYPWARGVKLLDVKKNTVLFSMMRTATREDKYKWVGPINQLKIVFFKKKGSPITLESIDDARKVARIGVTRKVANYDILAAMGFKNLVIFGGSDDKNIRKLLKGKIDLWPYENAAGLYNAKEMGKAGQIEVIPNVTLFSGGLYIAFNKTTDDKVIKQWQDAFNELRDTKIIEKIINKYK